MNKRISIMLFFLLGTVYSCKSFEIGHIEIGYSMPMPVLVSQFVTLLKQQKGKEALAMLDSNTNSSPLFQTDPWYTSLHLYLLSSLPDDQHAAIIRTLCSKTDNIWRQVSLFMHVYRTNSVVIAEYLKEPQALDFIAKTFESSFFDNSDIPQETREMFFRAGFARKDIQATYDNRKRPQE